MIGYSRRSVDEYLVEAKDHGTYTSFICDEYDQFPEERKRLSPDLFVQAEPVLNCIPGFSVLKIHCNLDPWGHYSSLVEFTLRLDRKFLLNPCYERWR
jgi:hypothetical protein